MNDIKNIYNQFKPNNALPANDPAYVNCSEVRGNDNIFQEIGNSIIYSDEPTCQLYTGHRGGGKSTELLRLTDYLEKNGCFVVYFPATDGDIDELDVQYTDIILACTRNILEKVKDYASPHALLKWLESRWSELKDIALSDVEFTKLDIEAQINLFSKLTTSLRRIPSSRETIRKQVDNYSVSLIKALNDFIEEAQKKLPPEKSKIVVIPDNLDRIVPLERRSQINSHGEIFINYSSQLTALNCHVVYTIPISLVYSKQATELKTIYGNPQVLPMIMVKTKENKPYAKGIEKVTEIITKRIHLINPNLNIDQDIFENKNTRWKFCYMTGGDAREIMQLMQSAIVKSDNFPLTMKSINTSIAEARMIYKNAVSDDDWQKLAQVYRDKNILNEEDYRSLLFRRCVLEYKYFDSKNNLIRWYDAHPLIVGIPEFQSALKNL